MAKVIRDYIRKETASFIRKSWKKRGLPPWARFETYKLEQLEEWASIMPGYRISPLLEKLS